MGEVKPPILDYARPTAPQPRRPMSFGAILTLAMVIAIALVIGSTGEGHNSLKRSASVAERAIATTFGIANWSAIFILALLIPRWRNKSAKARNSNLKDTDLPVPWVYRLLLQLLLVAALLFGMNVRECPHGTFVSIGSCGIALQGVPCNNGQEPVPLVVWFIRQAVR